MPSRPRAGSAAAVLLITLGALAPGVGASAAPSAPGGQVRHIHQRGTAEYHPTGTGTGAPGPLSTEIPHRVGADDTHAAAPQNRTLAPTGAAERSAMARAALAPPPPPGVIRTPRLVTSFDGINHRQQRTANNGNQFSLEPPDQALCVGNGHVVEAVNDAFRVYGTNGTGQTGVVDLNTFFGYPPAINRSTGVFGPQITDPTCLYDPTTRRFFLVVLTLGTTTDGDFTGQNQLDIAVTGDPTGVWKTYAVDATDDGRNGTPVHPNCPCIGDYPHVGVDAYGFYITTNEYAFFGDAYNSAQVYAFSKRALARGDADVLVTQIDTTAADAGRNGFTLWPAQSPSTGDYDRSQKGTAYFLSSNAAEEATGTDDYVSDSIVTWSLTNTRSLDAARPGIRLHDTRVGVQTYSLPPLADQKAGPAPLAECLNTPACATVLLGAPDPSAPETLSRLDSNDTRMQQVTYTGGRLYGALDTAVRAGGAVEAGIGWYIVQPRSSSTSVRASLLRQGQLGLAGNNLIYPAIGVTAQGHGVMAFTLVGDGYYPSAAYASFDGRAGAGAIYLAKAGVGPQDGFSGYRAFNDPPRPRWGDYGATAVDGHRIWIASEYIGQQCTLTQYTADPFGSCGSTRTALANWGTRISLIKP
ncbi:hypothetical protein [Krasilnikovia sp. MM14-A1004]|uniref:hypothetical protein n=1 Tax=Krasilnikovia sp. MM14-A1004 TaxID=3373541 RepID=UPI00399CBB45